MAVRRMPYEQFAELLEEKSGNYFQGLYYQVPNHDLERGIVRVSEYRSLSYMFDVEETFDKLNLYLDHLDMDLSEYLSQAITNEMDASMTSTKDKGKDAIEGVEARTNTTDKGKEKVSQDATKSDKLVDYLSPGEEELIELKNRIKANREAKAKVKDNPFLEMNEPNDKNSMPTDNVRGETFKEHDIYMNELLKSLKNADNDGITEDPFIFVEKHVERYPMYDETTHWRLRKPKFKEFLTYYALENGFSLCYERSYEARVVAKCGRRPPRLSDPEKGKQTKQTRYPSASIDEFPTCPWRWYARWMTDEKTFQCISIEDEHTGVRNFNFGSLVNPDIRLCDIVDLVMKKYKCKITPNQCTNAKKYALTEYEKTVGEHYAMLRSYGKEILDSNRGSSVKLGVIVNPYDKTYFDRKQYPGLEFRQLFWAASKASYPWFFNKIIDKIKSVNLNAHKYLMDKNPKTWSRAFSEVGRGCEGIENGFGFTVDEGKRTCSCRMWQLLGIPCVHATKVIFLINRAPESYVPAWFETDMYYVAYHNFVKPVPGMNFWPD
ncbi:multidrug resistance-associated protein 5 [Tanacetum coccineum]